MIKDMSVITPEYFKYRLEQETEQYKQEIERLNNIINELERYLIEDNYKNEDVWCITTQEVLNKLQELKGER